MQTKSKPPAGAPTRGYMPQTDVPGVDRVTTVLKKGVVNWNKPY